MKLAEALLVRKDLQAKIDRMGDIAPRELYEVATKRGKNEDGFQDMIAQVPKISYQQFVHAYDWHARQLRLVDAAIQQANWTTDIEGVHGGEYIDPYVKDEKKT